MVLCGGVFYLSACSYLAHATDQAQLRRLLQAQYNSRVGISLGKEHDGLTTAHGNHHPTLILYSQNALSLLYSVYL